MTYSFSSMRRQATRKRRRARPAGPLLSAGGAAALDVPDVDRLRALVAGLRLVLDPGALGERAIAVRLDAAVVDEQVLRAFIGRDEPEALLVAEPLNGASCHVFLHGVFVLRLPW